MPSGLFPEGGQGYILTTFQAILPLDKFPHTAGTYVRHPDINPEQSCHVETVVLMARVEG